MAQGETISLPIGSSWRMVDGENDSFDTSILQDDLEADIVLSSGPSQLSSGPSQFSSQEHGSIRGSQDSLQDFIQRADDDQIIMRSPFRPTVPGATRASSLTARDSERTPDPEFFMPSVPVETARKTGSVIRSPRGVQTSTRPLPDEDDAPAYSLRRRPNRPVPPPNYVSNNGGSPTSRRNGPRRPSAGGAHYLHAGGARTGAPPPTAQGMSVGDRLAESIPNAVFHSLAWVFGLVAMALRFAQRPLALLLAAYLFFGGLIVVQNTMTQSLLVSLSPVCRIPGVSLIGLPFCPNPRPPQYDGRAHEKGATAQDDRRESTNGLPYSEFQELMGVQTEVSRVAAHSIEGASLPLEMKRSELSVRDLRTLVKHSELPNKTPLIEEFEGYIDTARRTSNTLLKFNVHVSSVVDHIISVNKWTRGFLETLDTHKTLSRTDNGLLSQWTSWIFKPFQPSLSTHERALVDRYIEHNTQISTKIAVLIAEATTVLRGLNRIEDHLIAIHDLTASSSRAVHARRDEILYTIWSILGGNNKRLHSLDHQLALLDQVEAQRSRAISHVSTLLVELETIDARLAHLRDRVLEPAFAIAAANKDKENDEDGAETDGERALVPVNVPLTVYIDTIDRGIERLEAARDKIRGAENARIGESLVQAGVKEEKFLE